jgi:signal transduction histidine kinase
MEFLVDNLNDYAQIKSGMFRKSIKSFNFKSVIDQLVQIHKTKAEIRGISLEYIHEDNINYSDEIVSDKMRI